VVDSANRATPFTLPGPPGTGAIQTAPVPAPQPAVGAQSAAQAAPNAALVDAPEDEHAFSVAAAQRALPLPGWARLLLGAGAVTLMAGAAYILTERRTRLVPGGVED
jgi:hypothetical protein